MSTLKCNEYYVHVEITITSETNDRVVLKLYYAHKHPNYKKDFKNSYLVVFVDMSANLADFLEIR